jgi:hypothetical protein
VESRYKKLGRFDDDQALAVQPSHVRSLKHRGAVLAHLKRFEQALTSYDQALALEPNDSEALKDRTRSGNSTASKMQLRTTIGRSQFNRTMCRLSAGVATRS